MLKGFLTRYMGQVVMSDRVIFFREAIIRLENLVYNVIKQSKFRFEALKENLAHERQNLIN